MRKFVFKTILVSTLVFAAGCAEEFSEETEAATFTRIFDNNRFNESYYSLDIKQTPDKGFLILAGKSREGETLRQGVYLIKTDQYGNLVKELELSGDFENAVPTLMEVSGAYYFFCMTGDARAHVMRTTETLEAVENTPMTLTYPAAVSYVEGEGFILLSYDQVDKKMVLSRVQPNGNASLSRRFTISDDDSMEEPIIKHFLRTGRQYPFAAGKISSGLYYFNGFVDYTFSLVFTRMTEDDAVERTIYGQHEDGGVSAMVPLAGNSFAASYFNFGANYFVPSFTPAAPVTTINNLGGFNVRELVPDARVRIKRVTIDNQPILLYTSDTHSKQIGLFFYEESAGTFRGSRYLGFSNPFETGNVVQTQDGGLAICGTTYIAGRFPRIVLFKLSAEDLKKSLQ